MHETLIRLEQKRQRQVELRKEIEQARKSKVGEYPQYTWVLKINEKNKSQITNELTNDQNTSKETLNLVTGGKRKKKIQE